MIKFKDLSWPLKTSVVVSWIILAYMILSFIFGFMAGVVGL